MKYVLFIIVILISDIVYAHPAFFVQFKERYVFENTGDPGHEAWIKKVKATRCNICHEGKNRKIRNIYGKELSRLLDKADRKNKKKIHESFIEVESWKISKDSEETFGDKIMRGELPGGE